MPPTLAARTGSAGGSPYLLVPMALSPFMQRPAQTPASGVESLPSFGGRVRIAEGWAFAPLLRRAAAPRQMPSQPISVRSVSAEGATRPV